MDKKEGKFSLSDYYIEKSLIFFESIRGKKIIAYSIIKITSVAPIIEELLELKRNETIDYFAIQISIKKDSIEKYLIICFSSYDKNNILHSYTSAFLNVSKFGAVSVLDKGKLKHCFFEVGFNSLDSEAHLLKATDSIIIENKRMFNLLDFYSLNLSEIENKAVFIHNFSNLIKKVNRKGFLIFTFKDNISGIFINIQHKLENQFNLENEINMFFEDDIINAYKLEIRDLYKILLRMPIDSDEHLRYEDVKALFDTREKKAIPTVEMFNRIIEEALSSKSISFHRLNKSLLLIKDKILFITSNKTNFKFLGKIFKKYYPKYEIYIIILDDQEYEKLVAKKKLRKLENVKLFNYELFSNCKFK